MSALPDEPTHFLEWLRGADPAASAGTFAPRKIYGEYLENLLVSTARESGISVEFLKDEVVDLRPGSDGDRRILVQTAGSRLIVADRVVLAIGNPAPQDPSGMARSVSGRRYLVNPWGSGPLNDLGADEPIALIGTGLTAVDIVVEAEERGHCGVIHAISRHGLLPNRHRPATPRPHFELGNRKATARTLLHSVRTEAARCEAEGGDWRSVVDGIRPVAQSLWRSLCSGERQRFVRHVAAHWDVHRHRVAPEIDELLQARLCDERLVVIAGRVISWDERPDAIELTIQRRGRGQTETLAVSRVINCTGPARDIRASDFEAHAIAARERNGTTGAARPGTGCRRLGGTDRVGRVYQ